MGGMSAVFTFALGVLAAAGLGLAVSGRLISVVLGVGAFVTAIGVAWRAWGMKVAIRVGLLSLLVMAFVAVSGALVGAGAGLGAAWAAREIAGAWGLGVLVLPVPAGLGIRELFLSLSEIPAASAQLGLVHRVVTLAVDVLVGGVGFMLAARRR